MVEAILGAVVGSLTTGLINLVFEKRKDKKECEKTRKDIFEKRPELAIVEFKDYISRPGYGIKKKCDIDLFVAHIAGIDLEGAVSAIYHKEDCNQDEWSCVIYTLKNVGKTDISVLNVISKYKKDTCIFPSMYMEEFVTNGCINYSDCYDRKVRVGETVTLKLCYHQARILAPFLSADMVLGFQDSNGHYWQQPLFAPLDKLYDSYSVEPEEYARELRNDEAIECFQKPYLW